MDHRRRTKRAVPLEVQRLENKALLSTLGGSGGNQAFVDSLYTDVLHRAPDTAGESFWVSTLQAGASRSSVQSAFQNSSEAGDAGGVVQAGSTNAGSGVQSYVDSLYETILDRSADASGEAFWINVLQAGISRSTVRNAFLTSPEHQQMLANGQGGSSSTSTTGSGLGNATGSTTGTGSSTGTGGTTNTGSSTGTGNTTNTGSNSGTSSTNTGSNSSAGSTNGTGSTTGSSSNSSNGTSGSSTNTGGTTVVGGSGTNNTPTSPAGTIIGPAPTNSGGVANGNNTGTGSPTGAGSVTNNTGGNGPTGTGGTNLQSGQVTNGTGTSS